MECISFFSGFGYNTTTSGSFFLDLSSYGIAILICVTCVVYVRVNVCIVGVKGYPYCSINFRTYFPDTDDDESFQQLEIYRRVVGVLLFLLLKFL